MDTYIAWALEGIDWVESRSDAFLVILAAFPSALLLSGTVPLRLGALAVIVASIALILLGIDGLTGAVAITIANTLLASLAVLSTRKRLTQTEDRVESAVSAIRDLEIAEERRRSFSARFPLEATVAPAPKAGSTPAPKDGNSPPPEAGSPDSGKSRLSRRRST